MKIAGLILCLGLFQQVTAQDSASLIKVEDVTRIEKYLSSDQLKGRASYSPQIDTAANFIISEFKAAGLVPLPGVDGYRQQFGQVVTKLISAAGTFDGQALNEKQLIGYDNLPDISTDQNGRFQKRYIRRGADFRERFNHYRQTDSNFLVIVDTSFHEMFNNVYKRASRYKVNSSTIYVLSATDPKTWSINIRQEIAEKKLTNIVGLLPGHAAAKQFVVFSAHYDHLGVGQPDARGDSIFNGANDDASGTTAVLELAKYFGTLKNNERSLIFVTFTAEEIGELGSAYFAAQFDPATISAMFNIEMIGTESKWGRNSAYITGYEKTDMGTLMQKNLAGSKFEFHPDPYPEQGLFLRSDNASLAKKGVPAHTISTSKMDAEKYYHTQGDQIETLDMQNMTEIIRSVALSAGTIVAGKDTPTRVK